VVLTSFLYTDSNNITLGMVVKGGLNGYR